MPSRNTYQLTWVSLTFDMQYLFTAAPAKCSHCSLPWTRGYLLMVAPPDLEHGVAPLGPPAPVQQLLLGRGVAPVCHASAPSVTATLLLQKHVYFCIFLRI